MPRFEELLNARWDAMFESHQALNTFGELGSRQISRAVMRRRQKCDAIAARQDRTKSGCQLAGYYKRCFGDKSARAVTDEEDRAPKALQRNIRDRALSLAPG